MMRVLALLACFLAAPSLAFGQMAHVQSDCDNGDLTGGTTQYVYTPPAPVTPGNLVVFVMSTDVRTFAGGIGTSGTTLTINGANSAWGGGNLSQWKGVATGADTAFTLMLSGTEGGTAQVLCFLEFSGNRTSQATSTANGSSPTSTLTHNSGSVTPLRTNNVIVASMSHGPNTWTYDPSFTALTTGNDRVWVGYLVQSAATAQENNATVDIATHSAMRIGAFTGTTPTDHLNPHFRKRFIQ